MEDVQYGATLNRQFPCSSTVEQVALTHSIQVQLLSRVLLYVILKMPYRIGTLTQVFASIFGILQVAMTCSIFLYNFLTVF